MNVIDHFVNSLMLYNQGVYLLPLCCGLLVIVYFGDDCLSLGSYSPGPGVSFIAGSKK